MSLCIRELRSGEAGAGQAATLRFGGRLRRLPCGARNPGQGRNSLRACALRSDRRAKSDVEARCARGQGRCAPRRLTGASRPARARFCDGARGVRTKTTDSATSRQAAAGRGDFCDDEERSAGVGARSALRLHACRICLSVARKRVASYAARPRREHRSAVDAKRRPPQHEPLAGAAWRDAPAAFRQQPLCAVPSQRGAAATVALAHPHLAAPMARRGQAFSSGCCSGSAC
jgi:hypothetical protein